jgi:ferredoxin
MATLTGITYGGEEWTPTFAMAIDEEKCIGCGRCFKSCSRRVLGPHDHDDRQPGQLHRLCRLRCRLPEEMLHIQDERDLIVSHEDTKTQRKNVLMVLTH